jgi:hypothetical protein
MVKKRMKNTFPLLVQCTNETISMSNFYVAGLYHMFVFNFLKRRMLKLHIVYASAIERAIFQSHKSAKFNSHLLFKNDFKKSLNIIFE